MQMHAKSGPAGSRMVFPGFTGMDARGGKSCAERGGMRGAAELEQEGER